MCGYSDAYMHVKGTIVVQKMEQQKLQTTEIKKKVIFKNCAPFTNCICEVDNTQVDDAHGIDLRMAMYNLIEYSDIYSKTSGSL